MKKQSEKETKAVHLGMVKKARCRYPKRAGELRMWDAMKGAPMGHGEKGERWVVEWVPGGRGKNVHVHLPNQRVALACIRGLAKGEPDRWGLFELPESTEGQDVPQITNLQQPGGGEVQAAVITADMPLTKALMAHYDTPKVIALLDEMLDAKRPIYASIDGDQQVVGYEPDWATRRDAVKLMLSYRDGMPIKRTEEIKRHEMSPEEGLARLANDPKARETLANYIAYLDTRDRRRLEALREKGGVVEAG